MTHLLLFLVFRACVDAAVCVALALIVVCAGRIFLDIDAWLTRRQQARRARAPFDYARMRDISRWEDNR